MSLDLSYVLATSLEEYFVDKSTGQPLSGGKIYYYSDNNRTILKNVFTISGNPPNYTYAALPNPITLSSAGTIQDAGGNNVLVYYFPQDLSGNPENYYIQIYNSAGTLQFTREAFPNAGVSSGSMTGSNNLINYVPNGQFLSHNDNHVEVLGVKTIAQGGWTYERTVSSTDIDLVSFKKFNTFTSNPTSSPRYSVRIQCTSPGNATFKSLRLKFPDVFKFASDTQNYTLQFTAVDNTGAGTLNTSTTIIQNFGTGGSPTLTTNVSTQTFPSTYKAFSSNFIFPITASTVGPLNDDFVQISINFPAGIPFDVILSDFVLTPGIAQIPTFPQQTNADMFSRGVAGYMPTPNPDGSDLYLPLVLTQSGTQFDRSVIGEIVSNYLLGSNNTFSLLLCDGSQYIRSNYSTIGIPYSRLSEYLILNSPVSGIPMFGTGLNYSTAYQCGSSDQLRIVSNNLSGGALASPTAGTTNFVPFSVYTGSPYIGYSSYSIGGGQMLAYWNLSNAALPPDNVNIPFPNPHADLTYANPRTSGFSIQEQSYAPGTQNGILANQQYAFVITAIPAATLAGKFFTFSGNGLRFYMWFTVDGAGSNPLFSTYTGIQVNLKSTDTALQVAEIIKEEIMLQASYILTIPSVPLAGQYFTFQSNPAVPKNFYVWYSIDGSGNDPLLLGLTGIKVELTSLDNTPALVCTKTRFAINKYQFSVPDLRGMFLRGLDPSGSIDKNATNRMSSVSGISGANLGTFEFQQLISHLHSITVGGSLGLNITGTVQPGNDGHISLTGINPTQTAVSPGSITNSLTYSIGTNGGTETRPTNSAVNYYIRY
jgi:hypothetical protein